MESRSKAGAVLTIPVVIVCELSAELKDKFYETERFVESEHELREQEREFNKLWITRSS